MFLKKPQQKIDLATVQVNPCRGFSTAEPQV
jgi:hypothetical protein